MSPSRSGDVELRGHTAGGGGGGCSLAAALETGVRGSEGLGEAWGLQAVRSCPKPSPRAGLPGLQWPLGFPSQSAHTVTLRLLSQTPGGLSVSHPVGRGPAPGSVHLSRGRHPPLALTPCPVRAAPSRALAGCWVAEVSSRAWRGARLALGVDGLLLGAGSPVTSWVGERRLEPVGGEAGLSSVGGECGRGSLVTGACSDPLAGPQLPRPLGSPNCP